jgi:sugar phosphate isomerase/epimerase
VKLGISTYSYLRAIESGEWTVLDAIDAAASLGAAHVEIVPLGFNLDDNPALIEAIRQRADERGIALSNYAVGGNFSDLDDASFDAEVARLKAQVDIARALGVSRLRHDAAWTKDTSMAHYLTELPRLADACRQIAEYAAAFGIVTSVENHGYYLQASDRIHALLHAVNHPNFKTTVDIGNFMCADEEPTAAVRSVIGMASMLHVKDFYKRSAARSPGEGWFPTTGGSVLRGAIVGHGDIDIPEVLRIARAGGYDGYVSIEFEGMEDCKLGTRLGFEYVQRILQAQQP